jgi:hypothetical protein
VILCVSVCHSNACRVIDFSCLNQKSPDGKYLVSGSEDATVKIWDLRNAKCIHTKKESHSTINDIKFHPTEMLFATAGHDKHVNFYDFETMDLVCTSDKTTASISTLAFDITGSSLACLSGETCRNITWEPSSILDAWTTPFGKMGTMIVWNNRIMTVGVKNKNQILAFEIDPSVKNENKMRVRQAPKLNSKPMKQSTPLSNRNNGNNKNTDDIFERRDMIPRSPPPSESPPNQCLSPIRIGKKKAIRPVLQKRAKKEIPVEIYAPPNVINNVKLKGTYKVEHHEVKYSSCSNVYTFIRQTESNRTTEQLTQF